MCKWMPGPTGAGHPRTSRGPRNVQTNCRRTSRTAQQQVDFLACIDVFWLLAMIGVVMVPIALSLKHIDLSAPARGH
jgi:hypothetical protein